MGNATPPYFYNFFVVKIVDYYSISYFFVRTDNTETNQIKEVILLKKVEHYFYPAIFTYELDQEIAVDFPDLKCSTSGVNDEDALLSARELLGCVLYGLEEDGEEIPAPTPLDEVEIQSNERAVLIDIYKS